LTDQFVVDTSILIPAFVADTDSARVQTLLSMLNDPTPIGLHIPEFSLVECGNVLWKRVHIFGTPDKESVEALKNLLALPLTVHAAAHLLPSALDIAIQNGLTVYDSMTIALAESLLCPLLTVDTKQATIATQVGIILKSITDFPEFTGNDT